jgi:signal peptidase I
MTPHTRRKLIHHWRRTVRPILLLVFVFLTARSIILDWNDVPSGSMNPTIFVGDRIFVNRLAYGLKFPFTTWQLIEWSGPKRGEIVVFYSPADGVRLVKRQIGVPGDHIIYKNGRLSITDKNGKAVPISYTPYSPSANEVPADQLKDYRFLMEDLDGHRHLVAYFTDQLIERRKHENRIAPPNRDYEIVLKDNEYFMMGDNRDNSNDCRFIGTVHRDQILGRSSRIMFSLDHDDYLLPRSSRFFKALP